MLSLLAGLLGQFWGDKTQLSSVYAPDPQHKIVLDVLIWRSLPLKYIMIQKEPSPISCSPLSWSHLRGLPPPCCLSPAPLLLCSVSGPLYPSLPISPGFSSSPRNLPSYCCYFLLTCYSHSLAGNYLGWILCLFLCPFQGWLTTCLHKHTS